ncbi:DUF4250 domain-containing protein [Lachnoclostridium sp. An14]|uniref:DUF4250 domain-containing protein n=1 Tax=Lachnoclostridium sp. An14 TaxID=1965562 RepID=UPI000B37BDF4|nr:DUF4250 domain-containing protein [Lachnoclostridium sp. An14]OUQ14703.1 DUF4250 domain-containing protein [Lachnoclostridium sp. An14]
MAIPKDPAILLSYVNTQLRDFYPSLEEFCASAGADRKEIEETLSKIGYEYSKEENQFI